MDESRAAFTWVGSTPDGNDDKDDYGGLKGLGIMTKILEVTMIVVVTFIAFLDAGNIVET